MLDTDLQAKLRLVPPVAGVPSLPSVDHLYENAARRPGELHERVELDGETLRRAETAARRAALPLGLAVVLLVEAALVRSDAAQVGTVIEPMLDQAAVSAKVGRAMSAAEADYLRGLGGSGFTRTLPTLPVRVIGRVGAVDLASALRADAAQAAQWEAAALLQGRTMLEWALMTAATRG